MKDVQPGLAVAKKRIRLLYGMRIKIRVNHGRNRIAEYAGKISAIYPAVFTFEAEKATFSFSYSDVVTGTVRFYRAE